MRSKSDHYDIIEVNRTNLHHYPITEHAMETKSVMRLQMSLSSGICRWPERLLS